MTNSEKKEIQLVTFLLEPNYYGIDISQVQEVILPVSNITKIPDVPDFMEGVMDFHGRIIPLINLRKRFKLPDMPVNKNTRILLVMTCGKIIGLIVDIVQEVVKFDNSKIEKASEVLNGIPMDYFKGVGHLNNKIILILELNKIFSPEELNLYVHHEEEKK